MQEQLKNVMHKGPKSERKLELKYEKGITLIALVITVVVILILAGISIGMLTGDNSIVKNAQRAKLETEKAQIEEKVRLAVTASYDKNGDFDDEQVKKELEKEKIEYTETPDEIDVKLPDGSHIIIDKETGKIETSSENVVTQYTLTIKYHSNTGVGEMEDQRINWNEEAALAENKFSKEGYIFSGWSKEAGGKKEYDAIETIKNETKKKNPVLNLYAVWTASTYGITYELNGGKLETGNPTYAVYDEEVVVGNPTKEGYGFAGWTITGMTNSNHLIGDKTSTEESVSEVKDTRFKNLRNEVGTVTFTAIWTANTNTIYTVEHYQMNTSGNYPESVTATQNLLGTSDATLTLADLKQNYTGLVYSYGQVNGKTETTTTVSANGSRVIKLYYARNQYTLNFNGNGGSTPTAITAYYGQNISMPGSSKTGHTFNGWWTAANGGQKVNYTTMPLNGGTLYAQWNVNQYTLYFNANGGSVYPTQITTGYGAGISMPTPTRASHTFNGWFTAASGGSQVNYTTMPLNGGTVYAHWTYVPQGLEGQTLSVGREVTLGGEQFVVIEDSAANNGNVKLLSKFVLNKTSTAQVNTYAEADLCTFTSTPYWTSWYENLNNDSAPSGSVYQKAKAYGASKGGNGRLITLDEMRSLETTNPDILYGKNIGAFGGYIQYWGGTAGDTYPEKR